MPPHHDVNPEDRELPWTSMLSEGPPISQGAPQVDEARFSVAPRPLAIPEIPDTRTGSAASSRPLIPLAGRDSPYQRNVLLKKTSVRRRRSLSANNLTHQPSDSIQQLSDSIRQPSNASLQQAAYPNQGTWRTSDPFANASHPGLTAQQRYSVDGTAESGDSRYIDAGKETPGQPLALGAPIRPGSESVPLRDALAPNRAAVVDVGGEIGVPSMYGSVGYLGGRSIRSEHTGSSTPGSELGRGAAGGDDVKGKGKAVGSPELGGGSPSGMGNARTRVSIGSK